LEFPDIEADSWYSPYLKEALIRELITGYEDGTIKPMKTITKAEFFTILYRLVPNEFQTVNLSKAPSSDVPLNQWYTEGMAFGIQNGFIDLDNNNETNVFINLNRGHVAHFLVNYNNWLKQKLNPSEETTDESTDDSDSDENTEESTTDESTNDSDTNESTEETTTDESTNENSTDTSTTVEIVDPAQFVIGYSETGEASFYGENFIGHTTASGDLHNPLELVAAHKTIPFNTIVKVTNLDTGEWVKVRINDRGPYVDGRIIDLSYSAFESITSPSAGIANVQIEIVE